MAKEISKRNNLKGLESIEDSILLLDGLMKFKKIFKVGPSRMAYPDPKAPDAKRPKKVDVLPQDRQFMEAGGMYCFNIQTNGMKRTLYLGIGIVLAIAMLLWRVWPVWLRMGVWYVSYYLLLALVSSSKSLISAGGDRHYPRDRLVCVIPLWHRFLDLPELLHRLEQPSGLLRAGARDWCPR